MLPLLNAYKSHAIDSSDNPLGPKGSKILIAAINNGDIASHLNSLALNRCQLGDKGGIEIAVGLNCEKIVTGVRNCI